MLRYLRVRDLAVFKEAACELGPGLNLITGETGAGKSLLVDAIGLLVGERASLDAVRTGEETALVEGVFDVTPEVRALLEEMGCEAEGDELVVRRRLRHGDRSRAFLNDSPTTVEALRRIGALLVEIHGQHAHQALLRAEVHRDWLDGAGGLDELREEVGSSYAKLAEAEARWRDREENAAERASRIEHLAFQLEAIDEADPRAGETEELRREAALLGNRERIAEQSRAALHHMLEDEEAAAQRAGAAADALEEIVELTGEEEVADIARQAREAGVLLEEASRTLASFVEELEADPGRLDTVEERLALLERLERRHGGDLDAVLAFRERARAELEELRGGEEDDAGLEKRLGKLRAEYGGAALRLRKARRQAAEELSRRIEEELAALSMEGSRFEVRIEPRLAEDSGIEVEGAQVRPAVHGADRVEFLLSPNVGEEPRPLRKIASGGELSRVMLALRTAIPRPEDAPLAIVFDEVDAGLSGTTAQAVAERLARVAQRDQVLCVTHLAQVAVRASAHLRVSKRERRGRTLVEVERVEGDDRIEEVARMLGGTEAAAEHARALLEEGPRAAAAAETSS